MSEAMFISPDAEPLDMLARRHNVEMLCAPVLQDAHFVSWPGSSGDGGHAHQAHIGGLCKHTRQVVEMSMAMAKADPRTTEKDLRELLVAGIWHDYGKVFDYARDPWAVTEEEVWYKAAHKWQAGHVVRSYLEFHKWARGTDSVGYPLVEPDGLDYDLIEHMILAHHGRKEWGSPVEPGTRYAQMLHYADMMSAKWGD